MSTLENTLKRLGAIFSASLLFVTLFANGAFALYGNISSPYVDITDITGEQSIYSPGETIDVEIKTVNLPGGTAASPTEGWAVQYYTYDATNPGSYIQSYVNNGQYNATFDGAYWHATFPAPSVVGTYVTEALVYCAIDNSTCWDYMGITSPDNTVQSTTSFNYTVEDGENIVKPNLTVDVSLESPNNLAIKHTNSSAIPITTDQGHTYIWIDGQLVWTYQWATYASSVKDFMNPWTSSTAYPQVLIGTHTVKACIDANNIVDESDESDNCVTRVLTTVQESGERSTNSGFSPTNNTNTNSSNACNAPYVLYQGRCTDPIPACKNPPAHFLPSSCIDKIENGQYIERYNFQCENGYTRSGSECVKKSTLTNTNSGSANNSTSVKFFRAEGNDDPFYVGDTVRFKLQILETPSNVPASPERGWSLSTKNRYHFYEKKADFSVPVKNLYTEFGNEGYWYIYFDAPTPNDYDIPSVFILDVWSVCNSSLCQNVTNGVSGVHYNVYDKSSVASGSGSTGVRYTGSSSARTDGTVSVPPAGFEKDVQVGTQTQNNPFSDTNMATVAGKAAAALYNYGIIGGFPDGEFKGARSVNRAEAAKFLLLSRYESVPDNQNNGYFYDVLNGEWYTKYVITAAGLGIIGGYGDGTFRPADTVNTAEFLKMLTLTFELETGLPYSFTDVDGSAWYAGYTGVSAKYKLFPDRGNKLQPARLLTRDEVAVAIYQYLSNKD